MKTPNVLFSKIMMGYSRRFFSKTLLQLLLLLALTAFEANAELIYRSAPGCPCGLIYDSTHNLTWTQTAKFNVYQVSYSSAIQSINNSNSSNWCGLNNWRLPKVQEFGNLYSQLPPLGNNGIDKYGTIYFGTGPNDYFSNIQSYYWTSDYYSITDTAYVFFFRSIPGVLGDTAGHSKPFDLWYQNWTWAVRTGDVPHYHTVSFIAGANGTLTGTTSQTVIDNGSTSAVTAIPGSGFHFVNWTGTNGFVTTANNPLTVSNITTDQTITANFSNDPVNGVCGSANGGFFTTQPSVNLCSSGSASGVMENDAWTWDCNGLGEGSSANCSAYIVRFAGTGSMTTARYLHTATLLPNGKVLIAGGYNGSNYVNSAELYDPATGTFSAINSMTTTRGNHTATLLPNGKVLIAGGYDGVFPLNSAELYDPATDTFSAISNMTALRSAHTATLLPNGKVLLVGGDQSFGASGSAVKSAELYDPATGTFNATASMTTARFRHTATLLPNGKVLIAEGQNVSTALNSPELYDSATGTFSNTGSTTTPRYLHTATLLPNGKVLVAGGYNGSSSLNNAELYNPTTGSFSVIGTMTTRRGAHTATLLPNGKVLIAGGYDGSSYVDSAELYDPVVDTFSAIGSMTTPRGAHIATLFPFGKVLFSGGYNGNSFVNSTEIYDQITDAITLTITISGSGTVHTASTPDLNCTAGSCIGKYPRGSSVILTPTPATGYHFVNWTDGSGNVISSANSLALTTIKANMSLTANFSSNSLTDLAIKFTGTGSGSVTGISSGAPVSFSFNTSGNVSITKGAVVTLQAAAAEYSLFTGWSGDSGIITDSHCTLNMTTDKNISAGFALDTAHKTRIGATGYFPTLQTAYNSPTSTGSTILAWGTDFTEDLNCNSQKKVTIDGGYNYTYSGRSGFTVLHGILTIGAGTLTLEHLMID